MRRVIIFCLLEVFAYFVFATEITGFHSIEFGASKKTAISILTSKGFKETNCNISFEPLNGIYEIVCYNEGTFAGKTDVRVYLYFFDDKLYQVDAINYDGNWKDVFDSYVTKYNMIQDKENSNVYWGNNGVYIYKTRFPFLGSGISLVNGEIEKEYKKYSENYKMEEQRKRREEYKKRQQINQENIDRDI